MTRFDTLADIIHCVETSARTFDWSALDEAARRSLRFVWAEPRLDELEAERLARVLRNTRRFAVLEDIACALLARGSSSQFVLEAYAQSLLEQKAISTAIHVLEYSRRARPSSRFDGLLGRAYKQLYIDRVEDGTSPNAKLDAALDFYASAAKMAPTDPWPAINIAAVAHRAAADGVRVSRDVDVSAQLDQVRTILVQREKDFWTHATQVEISLARGDVDAALVAAAQFVTAGGDRFAYASLLRQLRELWRVDEADPKVRLVTGLLEAQLLESSGGSIPAGSAPIAQVPDGFESRFGGAFTTLEAYRRGLACADSVSRIGRQYDMSRGTGFVVRGDCIHPSFAARPLLVTNAHVLATRDVDQDPAVLPERALITFEAGPNAGPTYRVGEILFSSGRNDLDVTVATLASIPEGKSLTVLDDLADALPTIRSGEEHHVRIIGHPQGGALSFSVDDNLLLDHDDLRLHYRAPTETGSSGSPVFDRHWSVIALHHRGLDAMPRLHGDGKYQANEGISILKIKDAVRRHIEAR